ncbi:hypothetical protein D3C77_695060 [compost metagenome]
MLPRQVRQGPAHPLGGAHGVQLPVEGGQHLGLLLAAQGQQGVEVEPAVGGARQPLGISLFRLHRSPSRSR